MTRAVLLLCAFSLAGCSMWTNPANPGNPGNRPYAGEPGSIFANAGPPRPVRTEPTVSMSPAPPAASPLPPVSSTPLPPPR